MPVSTNLAGTVQGAQKVAQLGHDAMEKILEATTQDVCMPDRAFMMFFETNKLYGDMFDAFLEKRPGLNFPTFFATACGSEGHCDWWLYNKRELLKSKHLAGKLQRLLDFLCCPRRCRRMSWRSCPARPSSEKW